MVYRPNVDSQRCFVLLPLRHPFLGYFEQIIKPAALEAGLTAVKADDIYGTRAVIRDIWELIWTCRVAVVIVTGQNPNVNYELGICHTLGVPTILVTEKQEDVPFDYRHRRYVAYTPLEAGWEQKLRDDLRNTIRAVLSSPGLEEELKWPYDTFNLHAERRTGPLVPAAESLAHVVKGTQIARHAVAPAFGPQGRLVSITLPFQGTQSSFRRGYKILEGVKSSDPLEAQGIEQMKKLASETFGSVGDATKASLFLSAGMIEAGAQALRDGALPKSLVAGMQKAVDVVVSHILTQATSADRGHVREIAQTAAGSDSTAANVVVEAMKRAGVDGVIEVLDGGGSEVEWRLRKACSLTAVFSLSRSLLIPTVNNVFWKSVTC